MKKILPLLLVLFSGFKIALAQEEPIKKQHGVSFTALYVTNSEDGFEAPVFMLGYRQRKMKTFSASPYFSAGAGVFRADRWQPWPNPQDGRLTFAIFMDGGFVTSLDIGPMAIKNYTSLALNYSRSQWAGTDLGVGLSTGFAIGSGRNWMGGEINLVLPTVDFYMVGMSFRTPGRTIETGVGGTLRAGGLNFIYYFNNNGVK